MPDKAGVEVYRYARMTADSLVRIGRNARTRTATDGSVSAGKRPCWVTKMDGCQALWGTMIPVYRRAARREGTILQL